MEKNNQNANKELGYFFLLTFGFSWILWLPGMLLTYGVISSTGTLSKLAGILQWIGGVGPSLAGVFLVLRSSGRAGLKKLLRRTVQFKLGWWYIPAFLILPVVVLAAHGINSLLFAGSFPQPEIFSEPWFIPALFLVFLVLQLGEELGWRGYALDRLQSKWTALGSSITSVYSGRSGISRCSYPMVLGSMIITCLLVSF